MVDELNVHHGNVELPAQWSQFKKNWCEEVPEHRTIDAQVLLGSDIPRLHPKDALDAYGRVIETQTAILKVSVLTGKYMIHGYTSTEKVEIITIDDDLQSDGGSICDTDHTTGNEASQHMEQSISAEIVEAIIHNTME